ncbi:MAG: glycosyltransferase, partial [Thermoanaerobaculia bacterium]
MRKSTICLNMIVKNEAPVIRRCLDSVRSLIDAWVIVDTGSTDGTQDLIREALQDIPGELHERPWVDFAHNRNEALALARGSADYVLTIDADEVLVAQDGFVLPELTADVYHLVVSYGGCTYTRRQLLRDGKPWRYEGVLHEYVTCDEPFTESTLAGLVNMPRHDGSRARDAQTYKRDALVLERALLDEPENTRYVFYLAQSYRDCGDVELALRWYQRRAAMQGWDDEVWFSLHQIAQLLERQGKPWPEVMEAYLRAYQCKPDRAEPLYRIGMHYQARGEHHAAHVFFTRAMQIPHPAPHRLFVERYLYDYAIAIEYVVTAHYAGDYRAAIETSNAVLRGGKLPAGIVDQVIRNRRFSIDALQPKSDSAACEPGPMLIVVTVDDAGPVLDDCVDSLLQQDCADWEAVFVSPLDLAARVGPKMRVADAIPAFDGVVVSLPSSHALADRAVLTRIRDEFRNPAVNVVYGQYRRADGTLGDAEPLRLESARLIARRGEGTNARFLDDVLSHAGFQPAGPSSAGWKPALQISCL